MKLFNKILAGIVAIAMTACDAHKDFPDTTMKVGHVVCTDGMVVPVEVADSLGKQPIAVVFHINRDEDVEGRGYAVYLNDTPDRAFTDSVGVKQGTSADIYALDGNANTYAMFANSTCGSPIAEYVFDMWRYGQSAYIPSVAQMRLAFQNKAAVNATIRKIGGEPLPDESDECWYWTSTEVEGQETAKAWLYSVGSGSMQETPKIQPHKVRPIITIND